MALLLFQWPIFLATRIGVWFTLQLLCCGCACLNEDDADEESDEVARLVSGDELDRHCNHMVSPHFEKYMLLHRGVGLSTGMLAAWEHEQDMQRVRAAERMEAIFAENQAAMVRAAEAAAANWAEADN